MFVARFVQRKLRTKVKYQFGLVISQVETDGKPSANIAKEGDAIWIEWIRKGRKQVTKPTAIVARKDGKPGLACYWSPGPAPNGLSDRMTLGATMYMDENNSGMEKNSRLYVWHLSQVKGSKPRQLGNIQLNLAKYATGEGMMVKLCVRLPKSAHKQTFLKCTIYSKRYKSGSSNPNTTTNNNNEKKNPSVTFTPDETSQNGRMSSVHSIVSKNAVTEEEADYAIPSDQPDVFAMTGAFASESLTHAIDINRLTLGPTIGEGANGVVSKGFFMNVPVAIKKLSCLQPEAVEEFENEIRVWKQLTFPNIIQLYGVSYSPDMCIVMELCRESLADLLKRASPSSSSASSNTVTASLSPMALSSPTAWMEGESIVFPWSRRLVMARDIVCGMNYLHSKGILHRDLKTLNVLLALDGTVKICDFGAAQLMKGKTGRVGTTEWMAPEVLTMQKWSPQTDVYSFGIMLWELASCQMPFANFKGNGLALATAIGKGLRPDLTTERYITAFACFETAGNESSRGFRALYESLLTRCWAQDPSQRPSFQQVLKDVEGLLDVTSDRPTGVSAERQMVAERARETQAQQLVEEGREHYKNREFEKGCTLFKKAIETQSSNKQAHSYLWATLMEQKQWGEALQAAREFSRLCPGLADTYLKEGEAMAAMGEVAEALNAFMKGLSIDDNHTALKQSTARCQKELQQSTASRNSEVQSTLQLSSETSTNTITTTPTASTTSSTAVMSDKATISLDQTLSLASSPQMNETSTTAMSTSTSTTSTTATALSASTLTTNLPTSILIVPSSLSATRSKQEKLKKSQTARW